MTEAFLHGVEIIELGPGSTAAKPVVTPPAPTSSPASSGVFDFTNPDNALYAALLMENGR